MRDFVEAHQASRFVLTHASVKALVRLIQTDRMRCNLAGSDCVAI